MRGRRPMTVWCLPLIEPDVRVSRVKCGRPHLMRYVAFPLMWRWIRNPRPKRAELRCANQGAARNTLLRTARELLVIAQRLDLTADQMISTRQTGSRRRALGSPPTTPRPDSRSESFPPMVHPNCLELASVLGSLRSAGQNAAPFCRSGRTLRRLHARPARFI